MKIYSATYQLKGNNIRNSNMLSKNIFYLPSKFCMQNRMWNYNFAIFFKKCQRKCLLMIGSWFLHVRTVPNWRETYSDPKIVLVVLKIHSVRTSKNENRSPKGNMWSAIPVALLRMIVNWSEGKQGSGPKETKSFRTLWTFIGPSVCSFVCLFIHLPRPSGMKSVLSGLISTLSGLKSALSCLESEKTDLRPERAWESRFQTWESRFQTWESRF